ncbi:MAG: TolB-like protein [Planctomycetota bacterium]|jgi:TolB-like protein
MNRLATITVCAAAMLMSSCALTRPHRPKSINSYLAEPADLANIRRIMVLPFRAEAGITVENNQIRDAFVAELQKLRRFEVVPLADAAREDDMLNKSLAHGRISTEAMVRLCDRYALDGLFVGSVTAWRPYTPTHLGLRTQLISVHSGSSVWAVDTIFDSADRTTISDLQHYVDSTLRDDGNLHGWEMTLLSPTKFTNFVAHRCVGTWVEG